MTNAYDVSKRVFQQYFVDFDHMGSAIDEGVKQYRRSNGEMRSIYMHGGYYRMAQMMIFLSRLEFEARTNHGDTALASRVRAVLRRGINAIYLETNTNSDQQSGGLYREYFIRGRFPEQDISTAAVGAVAAMCAIIKGHGYNLMAGMHNTRTDILYEQTFEWFGAYHTETGRSLLDDSGLSPNRRSFENMMAEYKVDTLAGGIPHSYAGFNATTWYGYAMAMDSYMNNNGDPYSYTGPGGASYVRMRNIGQYIVNALVYDISQGSYTGKTMTTGGRRPYLIAGYTSWSTMHLGMMAFGTVHNRQFHEEVDSIFQQGAKDLQDGYIVIGNRHLYNLRGEMVTVIPDNLNPNMSIRQNTTDYPTHMASSVGRPVDKGGFLANMNTGDVQGNQPFTDWWTNHIYSFYSDSANHDTAIEFSIASDWRASVRGADRERSAHQITEPNFLRGLNALGHGMMRRLTFN
ncbi:hypothetical protein [Geomicrobium sp. JCM 19038]|uniref:hypothetical protein n=1 Tax=Geomicrobium sp. JCM 19038 TaxID=1460635 RepID=UPI00045F13A8|nr:hypothetical protein [Geomicrobium sp. JCM 19038]GAK09638.1 hypothetical protein JCM19038_3485 [Geomicrobium sp. JCM 19038]